MLTKFIVNINLCTKTITLSKYVQNNECRVPTTDKFTSAQETNNHEDLSSVFIRQLLHRKPVQRAPNSRHNQLKIDLVCFTQEFRFTYLYQNPEAAIIEQKFN